MTKPDKKYKWLWLKIKVRISPGKGRRLIERFGSVDGVYDAERPDFEGCRFLRKDDVDRLCDKSMDGIEAYEHSLRVNGVHILTIDMEEYPELLKNGENPPYLLFVKGQLLNLNKYLCIAVVGTREPTVYGQRITDSLSYSLAKSGVVIVSGMALGVDAIAHAAALRAGMPTVAVLGCGVNVVYPKTHTELYENIARTGMVISEYPLSAPAERYNFPERNRIIAGISHGIAVTEADVGSGSIITADSGLKSGRDIFSVPGNADSSTSKGTNLLIKQGACVLTEAADILEVYYNTDIDLIKNGLGDFIVCNQNSEAGEQSVPEVSRETFEPAEVKPAEPVPVQGGNDDEKIIAALGEKPLTVDQLGYVTSIPFAELNMKLLMLEVGGKIRRTNGNYYTTV